MANPRLLEYQKRTISKMIEKMMEIDFSNISEVKELKRVLIEEVRFNIEFHVELHDGTDNDIEYHDCAEFESRNKFGSKMLRIIEETIRELENER